MCVDVGVRACACACERFSRFLQAVFYGPTSLALPRLASPLLYSKGLGTVILQYYVLCTSVQIVP